MAPRSSQKLSRFEWLSRHYGTIFLQGDHSLLDAEETTPPCPVCAGHNDRNSKVVCYNVSLIGVLGDALILKNSG